jgi:hypothetical protein
MIDRVSGTKLYYIAGYLIHSLQINHLKARKEHNRDVMYVAVLDALLADKKTEQHLLPGPEHMTFIRVRECKVQYVARCL